jgi:hypothetical protein
MDRKSEMQQFQTKWAEYLTDEVHSDLKPLIYLDPDRTLLKPKSLYQKYELHNSHLKNKIGVYHVYEREL